MTEDVIINKFLVLGGTTKASISASTVGGFGKAKELLVLPWLSWSIQSRDTIAEGMGIEYDIKKVSAIRGTKLTVVMPLDNCTSAEACQSFLRKCYILGVSFTIIDEPLQGEGDRSRITVKANLKVSNPVKVLEEKAEIYWTKEKITSWPSILVRANGLYMFQRYLGGAEGFQGNIVVELIAKSVDVLTANRDGFRDNSLLAGIDRFAGEVAVDVKSALRKEKGLIKKLYRGSGKHSSALKLRDLRAVLEMGAGGSPPVAFDYGLIKRIRELLEKYTKEAPNEGMSEQPISRAAPPIFRIPAGITATVLDIKSKGADHIENAIRQLAWEPDFFISNEKEGFTIPKRFFPETMSPNVLKLARLWSELCRFVLIQLGSRYEYGIGFIFTDKGDGEGALARYSNEEGGHWLLLNPYQDADINGKIYSLSSEEDLDKLYAYAIHEATHLADGINYHNEAFASAITKNFAKCARGRRHLRAIRKGIVKGV